MKKVLSLFLSLVMLLSVTAGLSFTAQAATEIKQVSFGGVVLPRPGNAPSVAYNQIGGGFTVKDPKWFDVTSGTDIQLTENSKFVAGKEYKISFVAWANSGYQFANISSINSTIDGFPATVSQYQGRYTTAVIEVSCIFTCDYKQITSVILNAATLKTGDVLANDRFTTNTEGVLGVLATYTRNGNDISLGEKATYGDYGAQLLLVPEDNYAFANNVSVKYGNAVFTVTGTIGKGIMVKSSDSLWHLDCAHNFGDWEYDASGHWKTCANCGFKTYLDSHDFAESTVGGNTVYTCNDCGYVKTAKNLVDGFYYADVAGGIEITAYIGSEVNIVVPENLDGKKVVGIGQYAFGKNANKTNIKSITLPSAVATIGRGAFNGLSALTSVNIPAGVKRIEKETFSGCSSLSSITVPYGVNYIGESAFQGCGLSSIIIPCSVTIIASDAFRSCSNLASVVVPDSVTALGAAFMSCSALKSVVIGNGVTAIAQSTFDGCTALESIVLPAGLTSIEKYNLDNKSNFKNIYFRGTEAQWNAVTIASGNTNTATVSYEYADKFDVGQHKYIVAQTVAATCVDDGYTLNVCEGCGDAFKTGITPATGKHSFDAYKVTKEPTCTATGEGVAVCSICGFEGAASTIPANDHIFNEGVVTKAATCTSEGVKTYTCLECSKTKTEPIAKIAHTVVTDKAVAPTFKKAGKTAGSHCKVCNTVIKKQTTVAKLKAAKLSKVTPGKKKFTAKWSKVKGVDGYQIQYCTSKKFKKKVKGKKYTLKKVTVKKQSTKKKTVKKLKGKKTYYVRIRAYKTINGKKQYSTWSKPKKVKTKK